MKGKIIRYQSSRKYGFIMDEQGTERFFHSSDVVEGRVVWGGEVEFQPLQELRGPAAAEVRVRQRRPDARVISLGDTRLPLEQVATYTLAWEQVPNPAPNQTDCGKFIDSPVLWIRTTDGKRHCYRQAETEFDVLGTYLELKRLLP